MHLNDILECSDVTPPQFIWLPLVSAAACSSTQQLAIIKMTFSPYQRSAQSIPYTWKCSCTLQHHLWWTCLIQQQSLDSLSSLPCIKCFFQWQHSTKEQTNVFVDKTEQNQFLKLKPSSTKKTWISALFLIFFKRIFSRTKRLDCLQYILACNNFN